MAYLLQPQHRWRNTVAVEQESREEQREKHDQAAEQIGHATILEYDAQEQTNSCSGEVEENQEHDKIEEYGPFSDETGHWVHNGTHK